MNKYRIAAVIVTHNRPIEARTVIDSVVRQTYRVSPIILIDSGSDIDYATVIASEHQDVVVNAVKDNIGYGAGIALGMKMALDVGSHAVWVLDDDSAYPASTLESLMATATEAGPDLGAVGIKEHWESTHGPGPMEEVESMLIDGALLPRSTIESVGLPRTDFFMMFEDREYFSRIRDRGLRLLRIEVPGHVRKHLGGGALSPPWRGYYQTRNELRVAIERRSPRLLGDAATKTLKLIWGSFTTGDRPFLRTGLRLRGVADSVRGRMGRTVEPSRYS